MANPMSSFLNAFVAAQQTLGTSANDRLAEFQIAQNQIRYQAGAEQREANLAATQANTQAVTLSNTQKRKVLANQAWAEAELMILEKGVVRTFNDPAGQERIIRAVNLGRKPGTPELVGFERMGADNAANWGMDPGLYNAVLSSKNPSGMAEDDDEVLVPLFATADGPQPMDTNNDGEIESWSAKQGVNFLRGQFVMSDEIAGVMGDLYTGQPGATATTGGAPAAPAAPVQPTQPAAAPAPQPTFDVAEPATRIAGGTGVVQLGDAGQKASKTIPMMPGESTDTAIGVPKEALADIPTRSARRVALGQGISPAQAKELAENPEAVPAPSPRAVVAAGAQTLSGLEQTGQSFSVSGGKRPTHKQLTGAIILMRAGYLSKDDVTRYADTGELSSDGVGLIQTGMQQSSQTARQAMVNQTNITREGMQQAGDTRRELISQRGETQRELIGQYADGKLDAQGTRIAPDLSMAQASENNLLAAETYLRNNGYQGDDLDEQAKNIAANVTDIQRQMESLRVPIDWASGDATEAVATLRRGDAIYNDANWAESALRWLGGKTTNINLAEDPLAVYLQMNGSDLVSSDGDSALQDALSNLPLYDTVRDVTRDVPQFVTVLREPMIAAAQSLQAGGMIRNNPDLQKRIYGLAVKGLQAEVQGKSAGERKAVLNDPTVIKEAVDYATRAVIQGQRSLAQ